MPHPYARGGPMPEYSRPNISAATIAVILRSRDDVHNVEWLPGSEDTHLPNAIYVNSVSSQDLNLVVVREEKTQALQVTTDNGAAIVDDLARIWPGAVRRSMPNSELDPPPPKAASSIRPMLLDEPPAPKQHEPVITFRRRRWRPE